LSDTTTNPPPTFDDLYPDNDAAGDWHKAHDAYLGAVFGTLDAAKLTTGFWSANANDPRDGAVELDVEMLQTQADEVHLCWQEERGWWLIKEYERDGGENQKLLVDLDCCTIASPESVARSVAEHFSIPPGSIRPDGYPDEDFPEHGFEDDDAVFELALHRYHPEATT
jgi:hypothetical protein